MLLFCLIASLTADASPWPVWGGQSVYVGAGAHSFQSIDNGSAAVSLPSRAGAGGGVVSWTAPLPRVSWGDVNLTIPAQSAWFGAEDSDLCADRAADDFCSTTTNLGVVRGTVRLPLLKEGAAPLAVSGLVGGRTGAQHAGSRHRLTALSEATTDGGAGLSVGRTLYPALGELKVHTDAMYWLRGQAPSGAGPADEVSAEMAMDIAIRQVGWFGVTSTGFWRLGGDDLVALDLDDPSVWAELDATDIKAGLKGGVRINQTISAHASVMRTVYARNNPNDTLAVGFGINFWRPDPNASW